jgi:hypothetical protein
VGGPVNVEPSQPSNNPCQPDSRWRRLSDQRVSSPVNWAPAATWAPMRRPPVWCGPTPPHRNRSRNADGGSAGAQVLTVSSGRPGAGALEGGNERSLASPPVERAPGPGEIARLRRSVAMLRPGDPAGLAREAALELLAELERLQVVERQLLQLRDQLRAVVEDLDVALD